MGILNLNIQDKLRAAVGTVKDHASIGKAMIYMNNIEGKQFFNIEKAVVRATRHDNGPIQDKHIHEILFLVSNSSSDSTPFLAERISRRLGRTRDPFVALKTLLLIHRLLRAGNCYFEQQLRNSHKSGHLQLITFHHSLSFLRNYAAYLEERMNWVINQSGKLENVRVNATSQSAGLIKFPSYDIIFRRLPKCQDFMDKVLDCWPIVNTSDNINVLAHAAMNNTLKESFQVYITYSEGIAALVNMFFELTTPARDLACQILKKAAQQTHQLHHLYENCKQVIENKNLEYPSVQIITMDNVLALEQCSITSHPAALLDRFTNYRLTKFSDKEDSSSFSLSSPLETKINMVWVLFEDEDHHENFCVNVAGGMLQR